jgi:hypothetical protein
LRAFLHEHRHGSLYKAIEHQEALSNHHGELPFQDFHIFHMVSFLGFRAAGLSELRNERGISGHYSPDTVENQHARTSVIHLDFLHAIFFFAPFSVRWQRNSR